jgi:hypothetical protein
LRYLKAISLGKLKPINNTSNEDDKEESREPDYDEDEDQLDRRRAGRAS